MPWQLQPGEPSDGSSRNATFARLREQITEYYFLDFSYWKDESEFTRKFAKLVEGLDLIYKEQVMVDREQENDSVNT